MSGFDGNLYPDEVWESIFTYSSVPDLKNLSLVCSNFYHLIGNSSDLMKNFVLKFNAKPKNGRLIRKSCRKYQILRVADRKFRAFSVLAMINKPIKWLKITHTEIVKEDIPKFFQIFVNSLEYLELGTTRFSNPNQMGVFRKLEPHELENTEIIPFQKIKHLKYIYGDFNLFFFMPKTLESLRVRYEDGMHCNTNFLLEQIKDQENLKKLVMEYRFQNPYDGNVKEDFSKIKFKLENLSIKVEAMLTFPNVILSFVNSQSLNLKTLRLLYTPMTGPELASTLNNMRCLETFELASRHAIRMGNSEVSCPSVKYLKITHPKGKNMWTIIRGFENVEELIFGFDVDLLNLKVISRNNLHIQKLRLPKYKDEFFQNASFRSLKKIQIDSLFKKKEDFKFDILLRNHPQLEEMVLNFKVPIPQKQFKRILQKARNLKVLEIRNGSQLSKHAFEDVIVLLKKLKVLKIYNCPQIVESSRKKLASILSLKSYLINDKKSKERSKFSNRFDGSDTYGWTNIDKCSTYSGFNHFNNDYNFLDSDESDSEEDPEILETEEEEDDDTYDYSSLDFPFNVNLIEENFERFNLNDQLYNGFLNLDHELLNEMEADGMDDFFDVYSDEDDDDDFDMDDFDEYGKSNLKKSLI